MSKVAPELQAHREWLGQIGQVGLVVSANVLVKHGVFVNQQQGIATQLRLSELIPEDDETARVFAPERFFREVLEWPAELLAGGEGGPLLPEDLTVALPAYEDRLQPTYAVPSPAGADESRWLLLIQVVSPGTDLDKAAPENADGWRASPQARFERLLRETGVGIGLLFNGASVRLVYAPKGESSGYLTFTFKYLLETEGRPMAGALQALLGPERVSDVGQESQRLPTLLKESRKSQNDVSTALADQVLDALWELVRGFQHANEKSNQELLAEVLAEDSREVYGGLLTTLMRLVFVLYAEDRSLMPAGEVYQQHYSLSGLFERLRDDQARYPDTMDARYGAWAQLLALFRLIHDGAQHGELRFVARHGRLFDPDAYPFLEGRPHGTTRSKGERTTPPKVSDGTIYRVLNNLLILNGERLSYRSLDVEQIGSVYEAMMGFALEQAGAPVIAVGSKHIVIDLEALLEQKPKDRAKWLSDHASVKLPAKSAIDKATTIDELVAAIGKKTSRYTPMKMPLGALYLQPTEERRRSGSHYTPRSLTEPIVRTTFRPIFDRLGDAATPEEILDLKVCDPAMGSGAFLVESCRFLAERLVKTWEVHKVTPPVPDDEDLLTYARRLVAERCLYGVDRNIFAVDLAKLSLWLATLAKDHPFTFLDHSLRHGDSLVGLSREQIASFNWDMEQQVPLLRSLIDKQVGQAEKLRAEIRGLATSDDVPKKARLLRDAEDALSDVRLVGDVLVAAFFEREKPKDRATLRAMYAAQVQDWLAGGKTQRESIRSIAEALREKSRPLFPFHWSVEFPEVFSRPNGGFDMFVGNPPFAGKNTLAAANAKNYPDWLQQIHDESHGNADLVAHFYRRAFKQLREGGTFGLIATNTIAQGDTRGTGLRWIRHHDGVIFSARKRVKWPGAAAVVVSVVHVHKGALPGPYDIDGRQAALITAFLFHSGEDDDPAGLAENAGTSFQGSTVLGMGFTFDDTDKEGVANRISRMKELVTENPKNAALIFPYLGGEEINGSPTQAPHRYVINFGEMAEDEARAWPDLFAIVEAKVKGTRGAHSTADWWHYERPRAELYKAIRGLTRVLALSRVGQAVAFAFVPTQQVFADSAIVIALETDAALCVLQSRVHEIWARLLASSMKDDLRYSLTDCFETFPFPPGWNANSQLDAAGKGYDASRGSLMVRTGVGLTKTYNRFHDRDENDTDIARLRELHGVMDRVVLDAYGWTDIRPTCEFILDYEDEDGETETGKPSKKKKPYRYRWPDDVRDEVLGRLLELNVRRAQEEAKAGAGKAKAEPHSAKRGQRRGSHGQGFLLD